MIIKLYLLVGLVHVKIVKCLKLNFIVIIFHRATLSAARSALTKLPYAQLASSPVAGPSGLQPPVLHPAPVSPVPVPNFYEEETKVFENENFAIYIQKQDHQRQKVFRIEDHLYVLRVKLKNTKKPPLLRDVRDILERAMESMVNELRHNYKAEEKNIIYLTMKQPGMVNALRSSGFTLQLSDTNSILKFVMVMLNRFLASNEELRLDQGFRVYFKIFSYNHTKWPKR